MGLPFLKLCATPSAYTAKYIYASATLSKIGLTSLQIMDRARSMINTLRVGQEWSCNKIQGVSNINGSERHSEPGLANRQVRRQGQRRDQTMQVRVDAQDLAEISAGASREGLSRSAFVIRASLARARGDTTQADPVLRSIYQELKDAARKVNNIGVNFNQVVRRLNTTGHYSGNIPAYAQAAFQAVRRLDAVAIDVWRHLR